MAQNSRYACAVKVKTTFLADQSNPDESKFAFAYTVTITNTGSMPAQLISRHWIITNARQEVLEVRGLGVIGEQPLLAPNAEFEYTSGTLITTATGEMRGIYQMVAEDGTLFEAVIEPFQLYQQRVLH